ncbi:MAG: diaminopimelate decarboxylase, partial [Deltaproteobacteria bacterium]|nr:diaminopimelate decarboxylase [Deltaproteobacteria bacterium]
MDSHFSEFIGADAHGRLCIEQCSARELVQRFGSPLFVTSEAQIRHNYRRFRKAFTDRYTENDVTVLYAIKANNNLAIRRIYYQEGAGCDCFGISELWATFAGGADPKKVVLNGSNKSAEELEHAVRYGVTVTIDCLQELERLDAVAERTGKTVSIMLRLKPRLEGFDGVYGMFSDNIDVARVIQSWKWGMTYDEALPTLKRALQMPRIEPVGLHCHIGRQTGEASPYRAQAHAVVEQATSMRSETGWTARVFDLGGGFAHGRDPESRQSTGKAPTIEEFAETLTSALKAELKQQNFPPPAIELEPGRFLIGNTTVLLSTVGIVKRTPALGRVWVNLDCSTNQLTRVMSRGDYYHFIAAEKLNQAATEKVEIVGPLCSPDILGSGRTLPPLESGDLIAVLDAGMYAESTSSQFNGQPRPASVLANGGGAEIIKVRETVRDVFAQHRIPERLGT